MTSVIKAVLDYVAPLPLENARDQLLEKFVHNTISDIALLSLSTGLSCYFSISNDLR